MAKIFNIYCDESCHLEHDHQKAMVIGATWCPLEAAKQVSSDLKKIKARHGISKDFEIKWVKVSPARINFYLEIIDYFFNAEYLLLPNSAPKEDLFEGERKILASPKRLKPPKLDGLECSFHTW